VRKNIYSKQNWGEKCPIFVNAQTRAIFSIVVDLERMTALSVFADMLKGVRSAYRGANIMRWGFA
jgi:hypothetical protein